MLTQELKNRIEKLSSAQKDVLIGKAQKFLKQQANIENLDNQMKVQGVALTEPQKRLYKLAQNADGFEANIVSQRVTLLGDLDSDTFIKTLLLVLERHSISKTIFKQQSTQILQYQDAAINIDVPYIDMSNDAAVLAELEKELLSNTFNLAKGPLFKAALVKTADKAYYFYFMTHNLVFDAWSFSLLMSELKQFYNAVIGNTKNLPERPTIDYLDYVVWQERWKQSRRYQDQLLAWQQQTSMHGDDLKLDHPRTEKCSNRGQRVDFNLPMAVKSKLVAIGKQQGATLFMVMLASIKFFLARSMGMQNICLGTINANRSRKEIEDVMGYFLNLTPITSEVKVSQDKFSDVIGRVKESVLHSVKNSDVYYEDLIRAEAKIFDPLRNPYFDVLFSYENVAVDGVEFKNIREEYQDIDKGTARYDLTFSIYDEAEKFNGWIEYKSDLFDRSTIEDMAQKYIDFIELVSIHPHQVLAKLGS